MRPARARLLLRRRWWAVAGALTVVLGQRSAVAEVGPRVPGSVAACMVDDAATARASALVEGLSVEDLAAQLLMVSVYGSSADRVDPARAAANRRVFGATTPAGVVRSLRPGGVLLLGPGGPGGATDRLAAANVVSTEQLRSLTAALRSAAGPIGLSIAADQEGGRVARLAPVIGRFAAAGSLGRSGPGVVQREAIRMGRSMAALGVDVDFAPVADVVAPGAAARGVIGDRSYGTDPATVAADVGAAVDGLQSVGVAAVAKHFPGHGETAVDTHRARAVVTAGIDGLERRALVPFRAAVAHGVSGVMVGHLDVPALDPTLPASLSPAVVGHLRRALGFCGIVYTDGLTMAAVRSGRSDREVARLAYLAGVDVLVGPPAPLAARTAIAAEARRSDAGIAALRARAARVVAWRMRMDDRRSQASVSTTSTTSTVTTTTTLLLPAAASTSA